MATDNLQTQRLELKYLIPESAALAVRDYISTHLTLDEFGVGQPDLSYPIHSLYLDSGDLSLYWQTVNGNKNRYKLRVRYYDDKPDSPVFFEIKRRMNEAILKQRGGVTRAGAAELLAGRMPPMEDMLSEDPRHLCALQNFCQMMVQIQARPMALVNYRREAWVSTHNNSVRVTMDRQVELDLDATSCMSAKMADPVCVFGKEVILELKFTGRFPAWFGDLVRHFGVRQCSAAKYADGLSLLREAGRNPLLLTDLMTAEATQKIQARRDSLILAGERSEQVFA
ncbi:MAG TPA: polyphosphate polymerase domain-containing protein [Verrucomicrobiae bacterium]|jgi:inorganic triphosphatase YgiF